MTQHKKENMVEIITKDKGWRPIPIPLKILSVVLVLWMAGAIMNLPNLHESGLPLLGTFISGVAASVVVICLDIIGPIGFIYALWNRKTWAPLWAFSYMGIFILNSVVAIFTVREELGLMQILIPTIATVVFLTTIYWRREYFK